jgi:hypothetical protein
MPRLAANRSMRDGERPWGQRFDAAAAADGWFRPCEARR